MSNQRILQITFIFIIFLAIIFLLKTTILENFIWKGTKNFIDFTILISWLECNFLGYDVYNLEDTKNCPNFYSIIFYGDLWLKIPFNETLKFFYLNILPYLVIFLLISILTILVNPKSILQYFVLILALSNPSTLLIVERLGFDIFVFLFIIFVNFNKIYFLNWIMIFCLTFVKVYPAILGLNIFLENIERTIKKNLILILCLTVISIIYFYLNFDKYMVSIIKGASNSGNAGFHYLFSLNTLPKILKNIFHINYILSIIFIYLFFIFFIKYICNKFNKDFKIICEKIFSDKGKLFLLSGCVTLFCFIAFSNYAYREIFILLLLPYLLILKDENDNKFINAIIFLVIFRFLFLFPYAFINIHDDISYFNEARIFSSKFLIVVAIKGLFDFLLMSVVASVIYKATKKFLNYKKYN